MKLVILIFVVAIKLAAAAGERQPTSMELTFSAIATAVKDPSLCNKISESARTIGGLSPRPVTSQRKFCEESARSTYSITSTSYLSIPDLNKLGINPSFVRLQIEKYPKEFWGCDITNQKCRYDTALKIVAREQPEVLKKMVFSYTESASVEEKPDMMDLFQAILGRG